MELQIGFCWNILMKGSSCNETLKILPVLSFQDDDPLFLSEKHISLYKSNKNPRVFLSFKDLRNAMNLDAYPYDVEKGCIFFFFCRVTAVHFPRWSR